MPALHATRQTVRLAKFWFKQKYTDSYAFIHINKCGGTSVESALRLTKVHDTARQRRQAIGAARWARIYTFSIVRHPFAKVVSHYKYRIKTNQTDLGTTPIDLNTWVARAYGDRDPAYYDKPLMFAPCSDWITDETGTQIVDEVFKLEEINQHWPHICARIGRPATPLPNKNATTNTSRTRAGDLLSAENKTLLEAHFRDDFQRFHYDTAH